MFRLAAELELAPNSIFLEWAISLEVVGERVQDCRGFVFGDVRCVFR